MRKINFTKEQIKDIFNLYENENFSLSKIGEKYGCCRSVITRVIRENNGNIKKRQHKYRANYRMFQVIDNPEKAYWLGFIAADGCVYVREQNSTLRISLSSKDRDQLEKFRDFMQSDVLIKEEIKTDGYASLKNPSFMVSINFNSKDLANDLIDKGIVPRKTFLLDKPNIEEKYYLPYILGYFDGDGSISQFVNKEFNINFVGNEKTLTWINDILKLSSHLEKKHEDTETYYIRCGGTNKPYSIMKKLYDSCETHLTRKYEIFKQLEKVVLKRNLK